VASGHVRPGLLGQEQLVLPLRAVQSSAHCQKGQEQEQNGIISNINYRKYVVVLNCRDTRRSKGIAASCLEMITSIFNGFQHKACTKKCLFQSSMN